MSRALVLGSGGITGIAWLSGALDVLSEVLDPAPPALVVGSSAGAVAGAARLTGLSHDALFAALATPTAARLTAQAVIRLLMTQAAPSRPAALRWLGRVSDPTAQLTEQAFVDWIGDPLAGRPWPQELLVVAVDAETGRPAYFSQSSGVDLGRALAASCAVPGVFPPVSIGGRRFIDGGLRSPANADLAAGHDRVLVLTPLHRSLRPARRPARQLAALKTSSLLITAPRGSTGVLDPRGIGSAMALGRVQARQVLPIFASWWGSDELAAVSAQESRPRR